MKSEMRIQGKSFEVIDTLEYITLADSFVKNKLGSGHGEAKLYVGNESKRLFEFFDKFDKCQCFLCKKDFESFLADAETEYKCPQQKYARKSSMPTIFTDNKRKVNSIKEDILPFQFYRVDVAPPRVYINSNSEYYDLIRSVGLPNISYLSVLKLRSEKGNISFYFKIFIDYKSDVISYRSLDEEQQSIEIEEKENIKPKVKETLIMARIGQGEYRSKLLIECPFCPFTMVNDERLLIASHIKPWAKADDNEKIDPKNGYMFTPTYDRLFDRGFITFNNDKKIIVSPWLSPMNQKRLGIYTGKLIDNLPMDSKREYYLNYHIQNIFKG